jgi:hypothetical protein
MTTSLFPKKQQLTTTPRKALSSFCSGCPFTVQNQPSPPPFKGTKISHFFLQWQLSVGNGWQNIAFYTLLCTMLYLNYFILKKDK